MRRFNIWSLLADRRGLAVTLVVLSIAVLVLGARGWLGPLEGTVLAPLIPAQTFITRIVGAVSNAFNAPSDLEALRARNAELEKQLADLAAENVQLQEARAQLAIVSALLDYASSSPERRYVTADVVSRDPSLFLRYVLLNKGSRDGLVRGMPVVTDKGLVGQITEVTPNASKVLLITDATSAVAVRLQTSRAEGMVTGQQSGELRLNFISVDVDLKPDEIILTSGLGGQFPTGLVVGRVVSTRKRTFDVFQEADVQSAIDFDQLETVLIITNFEPPQLGPLLGTPTPAP
nr:rod shape-determining protein MreC [Chloroflexota bacterium]